MNIEYSNRAIDDLVNISAYTRRAFGERVAAALEAHIRKTVNRIGRHPKSASEVKQRPGAHVVPLVRYPFTIFYRILDDRVRIQHIRSTSRRNWESE